MANKALSDKVTEYIKSQTLKNWLDEADADDLLLSR
jgi:hypothetical protein